MGVIPQTLRRAEPQQAVPVLPEPADEGYG